MMLQLIIDRSNTNKYEHEITNPIELLCGLALIRFPSTDLITVVFTLFQINEILSRLHL